MFELLRGDHLRAAPNAVELARLAREHDLAFFRALGVFHEGVARAESGALGDGLGDMRRGAELLREQNVLIFDGLVKIALAEAEARAGDPDRAIVVLDEGLATCERTGLSLVRSGVASRPRRNAAEAGPRQPAPAEKAFLSAIAVARQQATRSFGLRAAFSLAKLYQSTGRPTDAHAVLAPALEGFAPTPEMPEIAEAQALLAALAETEEVKSDAARRRRDAQLHVAYGNALIPARGYGAPETEAAFAAARERADSSDSAPERLAADYGLWASSYLQGELPSMRAHAAAFLRDVEARPESPEASVAHRVAGTTHWYAGEWVEALPHLERALALFKPGRDDDLAFRFGQDAGVAAMLHLAIVSWQLGDAARSHSLVESARARGEGLARVQTRAYGANHAALLGLMRRDVEQIASATAELARLVRDHELKFFRPQSVFLEAWVKAERDGLADGLADMRHGMELLRGPNAVAEGLLKAALAEAEARVGEPERALWTLDEALSSSGRTGHRAFDAELHRMRGEILLKRTPTDVAPAEEAFETALVIAGRQGARSFALRAALSLARTPPVGWPARRRLRRPRARARRVFADAKDAGDRRGAGAAGGGGGDG